MKDLEGFTKYVQQQSKDLHFVAECLTRLSGAFAQTGNEKVSKDLDRYAFYIHSNMDNLMKNWSLCLGHKMVELEVEREEQ